MFIPDSIATMPGPRVGPEVELDLHPWVEIELSGAS
jgi:hypothetical protein